MSLYPCLVHLPQGLARPSSLCYTPSSPVCPPAPVRTACNLGLSDLQQHRSTALSQLPVRAPTAAPIQPNTVLRDKTHSFKFRISCKLRRNTKDFNPSHYIPRLDRRFQTFPLTTHTPSNSDVIKLVRGISQQRLAESSYHLSASITP